MARERGEIMRSLPLMIFALLAGCATAAPEPISLQQRLTFQETVRAAEHQLASGDFPPVVAVRLREAKSDFYYAEHSPSAPERANSLAIKAQKDAEAVLEMTRRHPHDLALRAAGDRQQP
jgi:hypothetical protein